MLNSLVKAPGLLSLPSVNSFLSLSTSLAQALIPAHADSSAPSPALLTPAMTALVERVSQRSLDFKNQRKAYLLRTVKKLPYEEIAGQVVNLEGEHPSWGMVRNGWKLCVNATPLQALGVSIYWSVRTVCVCGRAGQWVVVRREWKILVSDQCKALG